MTAEEFNKKAGVKVKAFPEAERAKWRDSSETKIIEAWFNQVKKTGGDVSDAKEVIGKLKELSFNGLVITDDISMKGLKNDYKNFKMLECNSPLITNLQPLITKKLTIQRSSDKNPVN